MGQRRLVTRASPLTRMRSGLNFLRLVAGVSTQARLATQTGEERRLIRHIGGWYQSCPVLFVAAPCLMEDKMQLSRNHHGRRDKELGIHVLHQVMYMLGAKSVSACFRGVTISERARVLRMDNIRVYGLRNSAYGSGGIGEARRNGPAFFFRKHVSLYRILIFGEF